MNTIRDSVSRRGGESLSPYEAFGYTRRPPTPRRTRRRSPLSHGAHSPAIGARPPRVLGGFASAFQGGPGLRLRAAAGRRERSPRCPVALQVQALRPSCPRPLSAPGGQTAVLGLRSPKGTDSSQRRALTCLSPQTGWLSAPSGPPSCLSLRPRPSPFPAGWLRPRRSGPVRPPARSPAVRRGVARPALGGGKAGRGGWTRRWGTGGAPTGEGVSERAARRAGGESRPGGWAAHPTPAEAPTALLDSPRRETSGGPASGLARSRETPNLQTQPLTFRGRPGIQMPVSPFSAGCTVTGGNPEVAPLPQYSQCRRQNSDHRRGIWRDQ